MYVMQPVEWKHVKDYQPIGFADGRILLPFFFLIIGIVMKGIYRDSLVPWVTMLVAVGCFLPAVRYYWTRSRQGYLLMATKRPETIYFSVHPWYVPRLFEKHEGYAPFDGYMQDESGKLFLFVPFEGTKLHSRVVCSAYEGDARFRSPEVNFPWQFAVIDYPSETIYVRATDANDSSFVMSLDAAYDLVQRLLTRESRGERLDIGSCVFREVNLTEEKAQLKAELAEKEQKAQEQVAEIYRLRCKADDLSVCAQTLETRSNTALQDLFNTFKRIRETRRFIRSKEAVEINLTVALALQELLPKSDERRDDPDLQAVLHAYHSGQPAAPVA